MPFHSTINMNVTAISDAKTGTNQTDSGNQATDSLQNLLKPYILLSLFQKVYAQQHECKDTQTQTHKSLCGKCGILRI